MSGERAAEEGPTSSVAKGFATGVPGSAPTICRVCSSGRRPVGAGETRPELRAGSVADEAGCRWYSRGVTSIASPETEASGLVLRDVIGEGGSGTVYAASKDGREIAVKLLREDVAPSARERKRFVDEAERMRRVKHPGLVPLLDSGVMPDGRPYIAMPRLHGETLGHRLLRGPLTIERALAMFDIIAGAVSALHEAGLVHRDIKPENIFLEVNRTELGEAVTGKLPVPSGDRADAYCHPVLLDLGIAQEQDGPLSTTTLAGQTRGTPAYMAPERFFGATATARSDVYELAVTLYAMLVGSLPWREVQGADRLAPLDPSERGVALPEGLSRVLLGALSTRPEARPASVRAFASAVAVGASDFGVDHRTTAPIATTFRPPPLGATSAAESSEPSRETGSTRRGGGFVTALIAALAIASVLVAVRVRAVPAAESSISAHAPPEQASPPPSSLPAPPPASLPPVVTTVPLAPVASALSAPAPLPSTSPRGTVDPVLPPGRPKASHETSASSQPKPVAPAASATVDPYDHM